MDCSPAMEENSSLRSTLERITNQRTHFRTQLKTEEDEPIQPYESYVRWLTEQENEAERANNVPTKGTMTLELLTILEEGMRQLREEPQYKDDLRFMKLCLAYAARVEKPDYIYVYLLKSNIGSIHPQLYEDYATSLEYQGRFREAEEAYRLGISRCSKAKVERLKSRYRDFKQRVTSKQTLSSDRTPLVIPQGQSNSLGAKLYRNPLRNIVSKRSATTAAQSTSKPTPSSESKDATTAISPSTSDDPYIYIKNALEAPPAQGKKAEKYRFNMSLLFSEGQEYCIQEARAKSMGLLGKKWGPPPASERGPHQGRSNSTSSRKIGLNDDRPPTMTGRTHLKATMNLTGALANEPTVTINTKEALKDVFGMYNSPEKSVKMANVGSKYAPVKKLEPLQAMQPRNALKKITELNDEEKGDAPLKAFIPFVDDENRKENVVPSAKFTPFVDENAQNAKPAPPKFKPFVDDSSDKTPGPRKGLRELSAFTPKQSDDLFGGPSEASKDKSAARPAFGRVFTPASQVEKSRPVFQEKPLQEKPMAVFRDGGQGLGSRVFSRPSETRRDDDMDVGAMKPSANQPTPRTTSENPQEPVFRRSVFVPQRQAFTPISRDRQVLGSVSQPGVQSEAEDYPEENVDEDFAMDDAQEDGEPGEMDYENEDDEMQEEYHEEEPHTAPLGGRLGRFDVMTPIAERTFECTRAFDTPAASNGPILHDALLHHERAAAEQLAFDPKGETRLAKFSPVEEAIHEDEASLVSELSDAEEELIERTGTLSLADAIQVASSFKPPNPCNPSDPQIINTLLSLIPPEQGFHDLRMESSGKFEDLQKFASKLSRRSSSRSSTGDIESFRVELHDRCFSITEKLGEGGFGAVFKAKSLNIDADEDEDMDVDSDDEDGEPKYALKVVKPRNVWEYHILRRIHSTLSSSIRHSIISPHSLYAYRDESFLLLDLCDQGTLLDVVNSAPSSGVAQHGAGLDELLVMFFAIELMKLLSALHASGFIHGDVKIDNCLLRLDDVPGGPLAWSGMYQPNGDGGWAQKGVRLIDFGRTIDTRMYPAGQRFIADWKTDTGDCVEMREEKPWTYQPDYYGLAGIIYCMLYGKYFDAQTVVPVGPPSETPRRYKIATQFKRYWQVDLWTRLFDLLLNPTLVRGDGSLPLVPELNELRDEMETWLISNCNRSSNTLKGLLKKVERSLLS